MLEGLGKVVSAGMLKLEYTECAGGGGLSRREARAMRRAARPPCLSRPRAPRRYELSSEFAEALEHALEAGRNTKVLLRVTEAGSAAVPY